MYKYWIKPVAMTIKPMNSTAVVIIQSNTINISK